MRRVVVWARFVRVYVGLLSGLDLLFGLRGCRVYVGLLSGFDLRLRIFDLGCGVWVRVRGSGGGSIGCVGRWVETVLLVRG